MANAIVVRIWLQEHGQDKGAPAIERYFDDLTNASAYAAREKRKLKRQGYRDDYEKMRRPHPKCLLYLVMYAELDKALPDVILTIEDAAP